MEWCFEFKTCHMFSPQKNHICSHINHWRRFVNCQENTGPFAALAVTLCFGPSKRLFPIEMPCFHRIKLLPSGRAAAKLLMVSDEYLCFNDRFRWRIQCQSIRRPVPEPALKRLALLSKISDRLRPTAPQIRQHVPIHGKAHCNNKGSSCYSLYIKIVPTTYQNNRSPSASFSDND